MWRAIRDYMEKSQPDRLGSHHRDYHVIAIAGPARLAGSTFSRHTISLQSKIAHQKIDISLFD